MLQSKGQAEACPFLELYWAAVILAAGSRRPTPSARWIYIMRRGAALCTAYVTARLPAGCAVISASTEGQLLDTLSGADLHLSQKAIGFLEGGREDEWADRAWGTRDR